MVPAKNAKHTRCYDLMLARLWSGRPASPGVLIHDSTLFDGGFGRWRWAVAKAPGEIRDILMPRPEA